MTRLESKGRDADSGKRVWLLHLLEVEAAILRGLPEQLRVLLANPDSNRAVIERLFPVSYSDPGEERENRRLLGEGLLEERQQLLEQMEAELGRAEPENSPGGEPGKGDKSVVVQLDGSQLDLWMRFVNDVRLVLATDLGVSPDDAEPTDAPPEDPKRALFEYLGGLESILVEAARQEF